MQILQDAYTDVSGRQRLELVVEQISAITPLCAARKPVPDVFSVSVPDSTLPIPSMESYHLHPCRRPVHPC